MLDLGPFLVLWFVLIVGMDDAFQEEMGLSEPGLQELSGIPCVTLENDSYLFLVFDDGPQIWSILSTTTGDDRGILDSEIKFTP